MKVGFKSWRAVASQKYFECTAIWGIYPTVKRREGIETCYTVASRIGVKLRYRMGNKPTLICDAEML